MPDAVDPADLANVAVEEPAPQFDADLLAALPAALDAAPRALLDSPDLERYTEDAARAAWSGRVPFAALCADLGRVAVEGLPHDRGAAVAVGQAMTRWAARAYQQLCG